MRERYYIRFTDTNIRFPNLCAVCGDFATDQGVILAPTEKVPSSYIPIAELSSGYDRVLRAGLTELFELHVPVCEKHFSSTKELSRARSFLHVLNGILIVCILYFIGLFWFNFLLNNPFNPFHINIFEAILVAFVLTNLGLLPSALERAIRIESINRDLSIVVLSVKHKWYRDALIDQNGMKAEPIN